MSDYNDGLLPEPCLRMDTHFGDEYESVEFGDGTGYVKAAPMLVRLGALHVELDELQAENAKLQASNEVIAEDHAALCEHNAKLRELLDYMTPIAWYAASERERDRMRELGVEADDGD